MIRETGKGRKELTWVPGHSGILGNELAGYKAKQGVRMGAAEGRGNIATPVAIRHHFRLTEQRVQVREWDRDALRGYTYIYTDKGPFMHWLNKLGRKDSSACPCGQGVVQNAAHILKCAAVADGRGRTLEQVDEDPDFCRQLFSFLQAQI